MGPGECARRWPCRARPGGRRNRGCVFGQVLAQPDALRLVGIEGHVHAAAMVEAQGAVHGRFTHRADRQRLAEMSGEGPFHPGKHSCREDAIAIVALGDLGRFGWLLGQLGGQRVLRLGHLGQFAHQAGARFGQADSLRARSTSSRNAPSERCAPRPHPPAFGFVERLPARSKRRPAAAIMSSVCSAVKSWPYKVRRRMASSCASAMASSAFSNWVRGAAPASTRTRSF